MTVKNSFEFVRIILLLHETRRWKVIMEKFIPHPRPAHWKLAGRERQWRRWLKVMKVLSFMFTASWADSLFQPILFLQLSYNWRGP